MHKCILLYGRRVQKKKMKGDTLKEFDLFYYILAFLYSICFKAALLHTIKHMSLHTGLVFMYLTIL